MVSHRMKVYVEWVKKKYPKYDELSDELIENFIDYLFALKQELETYDQTQEKITRCDMEIEKMLNEIIQSDDNKRQHHLEPKTHKRVNKNTPKDIDLNLKAYQLFEGTYLMAWLPTTR